MAPLTEALAAACVRFAASTAVTGATATLTYREIARLASGLDERLRAQALRPHEPVVLLVGNRPGDVAAFLGVWQAGGVVVPVHRASPPAVVERLRARCGARFVLGDPAVEPLALAGPPPARPLLSGAAYVIFTSGSTGEPKGVVLRHDRQMAKLLAGQERLRFDAGTRFLVPLQITFVFGIWATLITLLRGGTVVMHERFQPEAALDALAGGGITEAGFVPTMLRALLVARQARNGGPFPARIHAGGEPLDEALSTRVRAELTRGGLVNIYGSTETCAADFFLMPDEHAAHPGSVGRPTPGVGYRIVPLPGAPEGAGELQITAPFVMAGYLDAPELTAAAFDGEFYRTGDLARERDGVVEVIGRLKDVIVKAGHKIAPLELDRLFAQHPGVAAALSTGVPDAQVGERVHLLVVPRAGGEIDAAALRRWAHERIEGYKLPDVIHVADTLPLGRTGKIDRGRLRQMIVDREL